MIDIKPFLDFLTGQTKSDMAPDTGIKPAWQDELMQEVDPGTQRRRAFGDALISLSQSLGSTPGSFLKGLGVAAPAGAATFSQERDAQRSERIKALEGIDKQAADAKESRRKSVSGFLDQVLKANKQEGDSNLATQRVDNQRIYNTGRLDLLKKKADREAKKATSPGGTSYSNRQRALDSINRYIGEYRKVVGLDTAENSALMNEDERKAAEAQVQQETLRLYKQYDIDPNTGQFIEQPEPSGITPDAGAGATEVPGMGKVEARKVIGGKSMVKIGGKWYYE